MKYARYFGALSTVLVVLSFISFAAVVIMMVLDPVTLQAFFDAFIKEIHRFGLIGSALVMLVAALTAFPAELPAIACGAMYGFSSGIVVIWVTVMFAASVAFAVGRYVNPAFLEIVIGKKVFATVKKRANEKTGLMTLFFVRLIPFFPFFIVNFASGMSGMRYLKYMLATGAGIIPGAIVSSAIGAGLMLANTFIALIVLSIIILMIFSVKIYRSSGT